jgi:integrase
MKQRDRQSATGLLPRMEARPRRDGLVTYRYQTIDRKAVNLGTDKQAAIRKVLDMLGRAPDQGTVKSLWRLYQESQSWLRLKADTQRDYEQCAKPLLAVFGDTGSSDIKPADIARYLRIERAAAPVRANREISLLGNLLNVAIERGELDVNPCKQIRRNREMPRRVEPQADQIQALVKYAFEKGGQWPVIVMAAEFASLAGPRQIEFLSLTWPFIDDNEIRIQRAKQRLGAPAIVDKVEISPAMRELLGRLKLARTDCLTVFPNRHGNPYTRSGFKGMWGKLMTAAKEAKLVTQHFTFHDLRAFYATQHKAQTGNQANLHKNPATTARIYDRSTEAKRRSL